MFCFFSGLFSLLKRMHDITIEHLRAHIFFHLLFCTNPCENSKRAKRFISGFRSIWWIRICDYPWTGSLIHLGFTHSILRFCSRILCCCCVSSSALFELPPFLVWREVGLESGATRHLVIFPASGKKLLPSSKDHSVLRPNVFSSKRPLENNFTFNLKVLLKSRVSYSAQSS